LGISLLDKALFLLIATLGERTTLLLGDSRLFSASLGVYT
jgi:hypothetical protein